MPELNLLLLSASIKTEIHAGLMSPFSTSFVLAVALLALHVGVNWFPFWC